MHLTKTIQRIVIVPDLAIVDFVRPYHNLSLQIGETVRVLNPVKLVRSIENESEVRLTPLGFENELLNSFEVLDADLPFSQVSEHHAQKHGRYVANVQESEF